MGEASRALPPQSSYNATGTGGPTANKETMMTPDRDYIRFNVLRNALYHTARRLTCERWSKWLNFVVVILGAAAMGDLQGNFGLKPYWAGAGIALAGSLQLIFDFSAAARDHQSLQREYYKLLADIEASIGADGHQLAVFYSRMLHLTGEERPTMKAVDARAYNDAIDGTGLYPQDQRLVVPLLHRLTANWISRTGYEYKKEAELLEAERLAS
ncbi:hypothetical protein [Mesorhizobium sp. KR1-2]|uniref:hypothetical protein n=1 Tax=Mesorhizobium sp. KR1-2 TaxID=3156609 RepID=UPI0032B44855